MENGFIPINKNHLEDEKKNFLVVLCNFVDTIDIQEEYLLGRPRISMRDVLKSLLIMSFHSFSYRRSNSDIEQLKKDGMISYIPKKSTLNKYMHDSEFKELLKKLIELCALSFVDVENCLIMDSTQFCNMIRLSASSYYHKNNKRNVSLPSLTKTRKLHVAICKKSKIIVCAETSIGTVHDNNFFTILLEKSLKMGFKIKTLLADAGYNSKENYSLCENYGIEAFIDFKTNHTINRSKGALRKNQLIMYRNHPEVWSAQYNYRPLIESVFSSIKRKGKNYIRSRNPDSQDCEMLLKALWYNLCVISKYYS